MSLSRSGWSPRAIKPRGRLAIGPLVVVGLLLSSSVSMAANSAPAAIAWSPSHYDYGELVVGAGASKAFTLTNTGGKATRALTVTLTGARAFAVTANTCAGTALGPGKSCRVTVAYSPVASGAASATLRASGTKPTVNASVVLSGSGAAARHIYWANRTNGTIGRADLDGSHANQAFISLIPDFTNGLTVDGGHLYWANQFSGTIGRADVDGSNANQSFITGASNPYGLAFDVDHIYWTNANSGTIGRADLDGSNANQGFVNGVSDPYGGLAVDDDHVYWSDANGLIGRANLDGTGANPTFITGASFPIGLAVDR